MQRQTVTGWFRRARPRSVSLSLPFGVGGATWEVDDIQRRAAWELYVELVTRVSVEPLQDDRGILREALTSLHALFGVTREILRRAGPDAGATRESVGGVAMIALNRGLRPFLSHWHPRLRAWESTRTEGECPIAHELRWGHVTALREELRVLRQELGKYADALAAIAGVQDCNGVDQTERPPAETRG